MQTVGYRTALIGKYLNTAPTTPSDWSAAGYVCSRPAGWDTWRQLGDRARHLGYWVNADGVTKRPAIFQMDYLQAQVIDFISGTDASTGSPVEPWFCCLAPVNPHNDYAPAPQDLFAWSHVQWPIIDEDAVDENGVDDKPSWIRQHLPLTSDDVAAYRAQGRGQLREIAAVDRAVGAIVRSMSDEVLARTLIIYASDNGLHYGEHRRTGPSTKNTPYDVSMRIPLVVRGPGFDVGSLTRT